MCRFVILIDNFPHGMHLLWQKTWCQIQIPRYPKACHCTFPSHIYISNGDSQGCFNTTRVAVPFPNFPSAVEVVHLAFLCPSTQLQSSQNLSQFIAAEGGWNHCEVLRPVTTPNRNLNCLMAWRVCGLGRGKNPSTTSWIHDLLCLVFFSGGFDIDGTPQGCFFLVFFCIFIILYMIFFL